MKDILQKLIAEAEESERLASAETKGFSEMLDFIARSRTYLPRHAKQVRLLVEAFNCALKCLDHYDNIHADNRGGPADEAKTEITILLKRLEEK